MNIYCQELLDTPLWVTIMVKSRGYLAYLKIKERENNDASEI